MIRICFRHLTAIANQFDRGVRRNLSDQLDPFTPRESVTGYGGSRTIVGVELEMSSVAPAVVRIEDAAIGEGFVKLLGCRRRSQPTKARRE